jgi:2-oxo-4-hydroxy-4-carboxy-5-ureidoimidazoline decarboxylase
LTWRCVGALANGSPFSTKAVLTATEAPVTSTSTPPGLARFNALQEPAAHAALHEVCASTAWTKRVLAARPYATTEDLYAAGDAAMAELTPADLEEAMAGHPPIGRPRPGDPTSAREQRGMAGASEELRAQMLELNLAYQDRFGHVFLICATGRTAADIHAELRRRLTNDPDTERATVRTELTKIVHLRLDKLLTDAATTNTATTNTATTNTDAATDADAGAGGGAVAGAGADVTVSTHVLDTARGVPAVGLRVRVERWGGGGWVACGGGVTGADGRVGALLAGGGPGGEYRLVFETGEWFDRAGTGGLYPEVAVVVRAGRGHLHVPLLLGPYSYMTYRGS